MSNDEVNLLNDRAIDTYAHVDYNYFFEKKN